MREYRLVQAECVFEKPCHTVWYTSISLRAISSHVSIRAAWFGRQSQAGVSYASRIASFMAALYHGNTLGMEPYHSFPRFSVVSITRQPAHSASPVVKLMRSVSEEFTNSLAFRYRA